MEKQLQKNIVDNENNHHFIKVQLLFIRNPYSSIHSAPLRCEVSKETRFHGPLHCVRTAHHRTNTHMHKRTHTILLFSVAAAFSSLVRTFQVFFFSLCDSVKIKT